MPSWAFFTASPSRMTKSFTCVHREMHPNFVVIMKWTARLGQKIWTQYAWGLLINGVKKRLVYVPLMRATIPGGGGSLSIYTFTLLIPLSSLGNKPVQLFSVICRNNGLRCKQIRTKHVEINSSVYYPALDITQAGYRTVTRITPLNHSLTFYLQPTSQNKSS